MNDCIISFTHGLFSPKGENKNPFMQNRQKVTEMKAKAGI